MKSPSSLTKSLGSLTVTATLFVSVACSHHDMKDSDSTSYKTGSLPESSQTEEMHPLTLKPKTTMSKEIPVNLKKSAGKESTGTSSLKYPRLQTATPGEPPIQANQQAEIVKNDRIEGINKKKTNIKEGIDKKQSAETVTKLPVLDQKKMHDTQVKEYSKVAFNTSPVKPKSGKKETMTEIQPPNPRVLFYVTDQRKLNDEQVETIQHHAGFLTVHPNYTIQIHGHTDSRGASDYNNELSAERAQIIANQLITAGVDPTQIEVFGWGSADPLLSISQHDKNRRVELIYLTNQITLSEHKDLSPDQSAELID